VKKNDILNTIRDEVNRMFFEMYQKVFKDGQTYIEPSKKTIEFISETKLKINNIDNRFTRIEEKLDNIIKILGGMDKKYASKLTQKIVYSGCGIILTAVIIAGCAYIIK